MLPNEEFALACRARYEQMGLVVDERNGEFAHCPMPEGMGDSGYYLLHNDHQHQGLLQSRDVDRCCFFNGNAKRWLMNCDPFPADYFELWEIYEEFAGNNARKSNEKVHAEKDENGKSLHTLKLHSEKDGVGRSLHTLKLHKEKDADGKSLHAKELGRVLHAEKDEDGKSLVAKKAGAATKLKTQKKVELTRVSDKATFVFDSGSDACRNLDLNSGTLSLVCNGKRKTHKGYKARYLE